MLFVGFFVAIGTGTRLALALHSFRSLTWDFSAAAALACGAGFDAAAALLVSLPLVVALTLAPADFFARRFGRAVAYAISLAAVYVLLFTAVSEWLFWDEFGARFNFIAVDYLVYTKEVVGNIRESYPLPAIFAGLGVAGALIGVIGLRAGLLETWLTAKHEGWRARYLRGGAWLAGAIAIGWGLNSSQLPAFANNYNRELAKNGVWSLFAAFRDNELDYEQFYPTLPIDRAFAVLREEFSEHGAEVDPVTHPRDTLHLVAGTAAGPELRPNVIQITVESLSASFLSTFNHASQLTPNLERIARQSLVFENVFATGTRTDRGMEALTLGLPPTPGRSLVKRPHNEHLFTLGSVFQSRGYDTAFIYGGYGYFDNMNYFFGHNGYRVIDRAAVAARDVTFANAWGACDEDLFRWTLREADHAFASGKPFHFFVMTTSNHRPYTYPAGRIDLPPKISGRAGAVKYTDFAIGQLLTEAAKHPWFNDTIFVIVADHCASVAGKAELPVQNYHIPLFIYAPGGQVKPGRVTELMSQVDYAPTLLGLLNWSYASRFYGWDVRAAGGDRRVLIGNYQRLGLYEPGMLEIVKPLRGHQAYDCAPGTFALSPRAQSDHLREETIAYYETASYLYKHRLYSALSPAEQARYSSPRTTAAAEP